MENELELPETFKTKVFLNEGGGITIEQDNWCMEESMVSLSLSQAKKVANYMLKLVAERGESDA